MEVRSILDDLYDEELLRYIKCEKFNLPPNNIRDQIDVYYHRKFYYKPTVKSRKSKELLFYMLQD